MDKLIDSCWLIPSAAGVFITTFGATLCVVL